MADDSNNTIGGLSRSELAQICDQAVADLQSLLRIPSVNPPGGELPAITLLEGRLEDAGLAYERFDLDGRPNLVSRLSGDGTGGGPLLLTGHVDVVPVEREHWDHDPFAGEIHDGYLFGRGAIDMKNMVTMCLHVISMAKRSGLTPPRDIIFAAVSAEEQGWSVQKIEGYARRVRKKTDDGRGRPLLAGFVKGVNRLRKIVDDQELLFGGLDKISEMDDDKVEEVRQKVLDIKEACERLEAELQLRDAAPATRGGEE